MKGTFTSIWDGGIINTPAILNTETGEVTTNSVEVDDLGNLMEEWFEDSEGEEYEICPECHEFILKDGIGRVCSNLDCVNS